MPFVLANSLNGGKLFGTALSAFQMNFLVFTTEKISNRSVFSFALLRVSVPPW